MITPSCLLCRLARLLHSARLLPAFALLLLATLWVALFYQVDLERDVAQQQAVAQSQAQARTLSDYVGHILRQAGHATHVFKLKYDETDRRYLLADFARPGGLLDSVLPVRLAIPMAVYDAAGRRTDALHGPLADSISAEPWFAALSTRREDAAEVSATRLHAGETPWHIQVARRLVDDAGRFAGAIVIIIDPGLFIDDYDRLDIDERSAVMLYSGTTGLSAGRLGDTLFTSDTLEFAATGPGAPRMAGVVPDEPLDRVERVYAASDNPRNALTAVVGIPRNIALAGFERQRMIYVAIALAGTLLICAVTAALMKQSARLRDSVRAAHEAQAMLRGAVHGMLDAFMLLKVVRGDNGKVTDFVITDINESGAAILGRPRADLLGQHAFSLLPRFHATGLFDQYVETFESGNPHSGEIELKPPDSAASWVYHQVVPIEGGVAVTSRDITARKRDEIEIRSSQSFLQSLINNLPVLVCVKSARPENFGEILTWNTAAESMTGFRADQIIGRRDHEVFPPGFDLTSDLEDRAMLDTPVVVDLPARPVLCSGANRCYLHTTAVPLFDTDGVIEYILCIAEDVTLRCEQEQSLHSAMAALRESGARLRTIADAMPVLIAYVSADGVCQFQNKAFLDDFGRGQQTLEGMGTRAILSEERLQRLTPYIERVLAGEMVEFEEVADERGARNHGRSYHVTYIPQFGDDAGSVVGYHVLRQDITSQQREKQRLIKLSQADPLTGLANRAGFRVKLDGAMRHSAETRQLMAVMYMDIDRFKPVNDTHGHNTGDALLRAFSGRLSHAMRASDTVARLGGDEFTVIMENMARREDALAVAAKLVAAMRPPFELDGVSVSISTSVGVAFYSGEAISAKELLGQADAQLYEAKQAGRDTFRACGHSGIAAAPPRAL